MHRTSPHVEYHTSCNKGLAKSASARWTRTRTHVHFMCTRNVTAATPNKTLLGSPVCSHLIIRKLYTIKQSSCSTTECTMRRASPPQNDHIIARKTHLKRTTPHHMNTAHHPPRIRLLALLLVVITTAHTPKDILVRVLVVRIVFEWLRFSLYVRVCAFARLRTSVLWARCLFTECAWFKPIPAGICFAWPKLAQ